LARWEGADTGIGEFFINLKDNKHLDKYGDNGWELGMAVFGEVVEGGMDVADAISKLPSLSDGRMKLLKKKIPFTAELIS